MCICKLEFYNRAEAYLFSQNNKHIAVITIIKYFDTKQKKTKILVGIIK